jgi:hypothetical protein
MMEDSSPYGLYKGEVYESNTASFNARVFRRVHTIPDVVRIPAAYLNLRGLLPQPTIHYEKSKHDPT